MKPFSEMTNDELDEHIAKLRGWKFINIDYWGQETGLQRELGEEWFDTAFGNDESIGGHWINLSSHSIVPDEGQFSFTTDPRYAMELAKEMQSAGYHVRIRLNPVQNLTFVEVESNIAAFPEVEADTPERAISEAYAQWKGEK